MLYRLLFVATSCVLMATESRAQARASARAFDTHVHLGGVWEYPGPVPDFTEILKSMNDGNIEALVDFKAFGGIDTGNKPIGIWGSRVDARIKLYPNGAKSRFILLANVPLNDEKAMFLGDTMPNFAEWIAANFEDSINRGAAGLKLRYNGGGTRGWTLNKSGDFQRIDGPEFALLWQKVCDLRVPCVMHFGPTYIGEYTGVAADLWYGIWMHQRERVLRRFPRLLMIGAHIGSAQGDFGYLSEMLARNPNYSIEVFAHQSIDMFGTLDADERALLLRHERQLVFGSDYMEATFGWLRSYRQRLNMVLPWIERWQMPASWYQSVYRDNPQNLFGRNTTNAAPVSHAGFADVVKVRQGAFLDGSGSIDFEGSPLTYRWRQVAGSSVVLSGATTRRPSFVPQVAGTYEFELTVNDGQVDGRPHSVSVEVVDTGDVHHEEGGLVVLEAENYADAQARNGHSWQLERNQSGYTGRGYMTALPDNGTSHGPGKLRADSPELQFKVEFQNPGTYVVIVRGTGPNSDADEVHVGLDGLEQSLADNIGPFSANWGWVRSYRDWDRQRSRVFAEMPVLNVMDKGIHTVHVWMKEDGFRLDRIILARHMVAHKRVKQVYSPVGSGPEESTRYVFGARPYGSDTPCSGPITHGAVRTPRAGRRDWALTCDGAPPATSGLLMFGGVENVAGTVIAGISVHIDLGGPVVFAPVTSDARGFTELPLDLTSALTSQRVFTQYVWLNNTTCSQSGLSASHALEVTIH